MTETSRTIQACKWFVVILDLKILEENPGTKVKISLLSTVLVRPNICCFHNCILSRKVLGYRTR